MTSDLRLYLTSMSVLLIAGPKCTLAASLAAFWWATICMPTRQTDRQTDHRTNERTLHNAFS